MRRGNRPSWEPQRLELNTLVQNLLWARPQPLPRGATTNLGSLDRRASEMGSENQCI